MPDDRVPDDVAGLRAANARLRELLDERGAGVTAELRAGREEDRELIAGSGCGWPTGAPPGHGQHRLGDAQLEGADRGERAGRRGSSPSGCAARTASAAGSPVTREKAWNETRGRDEHRGSARGVPVLQGVPGQRRCRRPAVGAGHRRADSPEVGRVAAAGPCVRLLRDGHVRGAAAGPACGRRVLRAGPERRRGAAVLFRERAGGAVRAAHRHAARRGRVCGLG